MSNVRPHQVPVFELHMRSSADGGFTSAWFDDEACLWNDERLAMPRALVSEWVAPRLRLYRSEEKPTAVLFNPNAIAVSQKLKDELASFPELEFLEVLVQDHGSFFILHVITALELPPKSSARVASAPSGNLVELHSLPESFVSPSGFFRIWHPNGSAARRAGLAAKPIYAGSEGKAAVQRVASQFLEARQK